MKTLYLLKDNLDIPEQNFIVKKGTLAEINYVFDANDETVPTRLGLNFDNINGIYTLEKTHFDNLVDLNSITKMQSKFNEGDCVTHTDLGTGTIKSVDYKNFFLKDRYYYWVVFEKGDYYTEEGFLSPC